MNVTTQTTAQKSLATTIARGATLLTTDGYTVVALANRPAVYTVTRPAGRPVRKGEKASYIVDVATGTCECGAFAQHGNCKHLVGATKAIADALALVSPMLSSPIAVKIEAAPARPTMGSYGSEEWKRNVARDFC